MDSPAAGHYPEESILRVATGEGDMKLEADGQSAIDNPSSHQVQSAIYGMTLGGSKFLSLSRSRVSYLQVAIVASDRFVLEYQEGGVREHYQSVRDDFSRDDVARSFEAYRQGADSWRNENEWRRIDSEARDVWDKVSTVLTLAAAALLVLAIIASSQGGGGPSSWTGFLDLMMAVFPLLLLPSAIINLRKPRTLLLGRVYDINVIIVSALAVLYWIDRLTSR